MRTPTILTTALIALVLANLGVGIWNSTRTPRIAYVRSQDLVYGYFGMKESMDAFQLKEQAVRSNLDTLITQFKGDQKRVDVQDREAAEAEARSLEKQREDIMRYDKVMAEKLSHDEQVMLKGVLGQVNAFVARYAAEHDFDVVLGTTDQGSLLFGQEAMDITDDLLLAMNEEHQRIAK